MSGEVIYDDSGALIGVAEKDVASSNIDVVSDPASVRRFLVELASEILRLQEQTHAGPHRTGSFAPEKLRRWVTNLSREGLITPTTPQHAATSSREKPTTPIDSLPTPTSVSDGRSEATVEKVKLDDERGGDNTAAAAAENRIAEFTGEEILSVYDELRIKKCEAEAATALLSTELVAQQGRHEEEKRQLLKTANDLKRRNEELESLITMQPLGPKAGGGTVMSKTGRPTQVSDEGERKFGLRVRALAHRLTSPHPRGSNGEMETISSPIDGREMSHDSCSNAFNTGAGLGLVQSCDPEIKPSMSSIDESRKIIAALEEQLRLTEQRAMILEQRLQIVKESGDAVIQSLNEELADLTEDRARSEAAMIKELSIVDSQRRAERCEYEKRIQEWIVHDASRKAEVEEYEIRIQSLLEAVRMMNADVADCHVGTSSSSWDRDAEQEMRQDLINYIQLLQGSSKNGKVKRSLVLAINNAFDLEFNANPNVADKMLEYYRSRPELKDFTLKSELPRMDYEVVFSDEKSGKDMKLVSTDDIRSYFASLEKVDAEDDEVDIILRAANQSLLADPLAMLTCEGDGKLVHSGSFHSTLIATVCSFKLDLRRKGQRRVKVQCELAICVPSGDGTKNGSEVSQEEGSVSATLELARANLVIQFSPSPTSTPSGPLVKYSLIDIKPTITSFEEGSDAERAIQSAAAVLARDRNSHIQNGGQNAEEWIGFDSGYV
ncbi:hypothetical protein ACHAW5_009225 [Stephanodiscus triporus]|uniref:Uncharacterized protein n=1 Tax=Stephanodiscus triporus TaxID=2934178 RepID=A0ABD3PM73_9STRA